MNNTVDTWRVDTHVFSRADQAQCVWFQIEKYMKLTKLVVLIEPSFFWIIASNGQL